ncbi:MAG TPA: class I SAM-dependent methyltransferase [Solirubrobacteraceae bacterium]|nr:class I SAM-dependent methyltransferase [Solirubrobacteraceae bacterium]
MDEIQEQIRYYRARAAEYDDWWFRRGRYDRGTEANARWFADAAVVEAALDRFAPAGDVVELACGTGLWTQRLVAHADRVTAIDSSPEAIELARERVREGYVEYVEADLFAWEPSRAHDVCFFGFWLSHVPAELFAAFWEKVARSLAPGGRVFFIDSAPSQRASAADHIPAPGEQTMLRRLADGREFRIVKHWFQPAELQPRIAALGWRVDVAKTSEFFVYGSATPAG